METETQYFVYQITFNDNHYIGCTNNIKARAKCHNRYAKLRKSNFGIFLNDNNIKLKSSDFHILFSSYDKNEALERETQEIMKADNNGLKLLNRLHSSSYTRRGAHNKNTLEYYVVNYINHTVEYVPNLGKFCEEHHIRRSNLDHTTKGLFYMKSGYKAFHKEDWEKESNKDKYLSGDFIDEVKQKIASINSHKQAETFKVQFPDGHIEVVTNLRQFEREHNLRPKTLGVTLKQNITMHGYKVLEKTK